MAKPKKPDDELEFSPDEYESYPSAKLDLTRNIFKQVLDCQDLLNAGSPRAFYAVDVLESLLSGWTKKSSTFKRLMNLAGAKFKKDLVKAKEAGASYAFEGDAAVDDARHGFARKRFRLLLEFVVYPSIIGDDERETA